MLETQLRAEIEKWTARIKKERKKIILADSSRPDFLKNIDAYISDSAHFLEKKDLIRSFEAIIWAWSWLEIGIELKILKKP